MDTVTSLEFVYKSAIYNALIRTKIKNEYRQHYITIMNGNLERLLFGNHMIMEEKGILRSEPEVANEEIAYLKQCIMDAFIHKKIPGY